MENLDEPTPIESYSDDEIKEHLDLALETFFHAEVAVNSLIREAVKRGILPAEGLVPGTEDRAN